MSRAAAESCASARWLPALMGGWMVFAACGPAAAVDLESLVSPGPLIAAHARDAKTCEACHERFERGSQNRLCLACHEPVAADLEQSAGFHGRIGLGGGNECRACHTEHKGEDADIVGLLAETFDHRQTDFALEGRHAAVDCAGCHEKDQARRDTPSRCAACHEGQDPHEGGLGERCESCHLEASWREVSFDHATTTFPLEDLHVEASCESCHPGQRFGRTPTDCVSCHRVDDAHRGRLGNECASCHSPRGWKKGGFDHAKETRFALRGGHGGLDCQRCHESDPKKQKLETACVSCHLPDDDHRGLRGKECESCHKADVWSPAPFDHKAKTRYALRGTHKEVACDLCHVREMYATTTPTDCAGCHADVDVHEEGLGKKCESCHSQGSWRAGVTFDHDLTSFPILALHKLASCEDCHVSKRFGETDATCGACHARADLHKGRLGEDCSLCHNPNGWDRWIFDHDKQTRFALNGGHRGLACESCHRSDQARTSASQASDYLALSTRCRSCHLGDSPHDDAYGRDCERCHVDTSWKEISRRP